MGKLASIRSKKKLAPIHSKAKVDSIYTNYMFM